MLDLFIKLVLAHLIGDFVFQPKSWVLSKEDKKHKSIYLYLHILVHLVSLLVILRFNSNYIVAVGFIVVTHFIIDLLKLNLNKKFESKKRILFFIDQFLHLLTLGAVVYYYFPDSDNFANFYSSKVLLLAALLIFSTFTSNVILAVVLSKWNLINNSNAENGEDKSLENAGKYIGMLERIFIFFLVIMNYPLGVGLLITAKSVFRYNDLTRAKDRKLTEYVLIGSMMSFGLAILAGIGYKYLVQFL